MLSVIGTVLDEAKFQVNHIFTRTILGSSTVLDEAKPELVKVWADFTRKYGTYC
jgi:hypothetical protein